MASSPNKQGLRMRSSDGMASKRSTRPARRNCANLWQSGQVHPDHGIAFVGEGVAALHARMLAGGRLGQNVGRRPKDCAGLGAGRCTKAGDDPCNDGTDYGSYHGDHSGTLDFARVPSPP